MDGLDVILSLFTADNGVYITSLEVFDMSCHTGNPQSVCVVYIVRLDFNLIPGRLC